MDRSHRKSETPLVAGPHKKAWRTPNREKPTAEETTTMLEYTLPIEFNDPYGDVILRSADLVDFRVYRLFLSKGSPVFDDMFCSPTPVVANGTEIKDGTQIVAMEEQASVIGALLQLCYPMEDPIIETLVELKPVLQAMIKYQMDGARNLWIKRMLVPIVEREPWAVYATALTLGRISCNYRMEDEARHAARSIVRLPAGGPLVKEMCMISGADYHRLLQYRRKCCDKTQDILTLPKVFKQLGPDWVWMKPCNKCHQSVIPMFADATYYKISTWWRTYLNRAKAALCKQPWGRVVENETLWADLIANLVDDCPRCAKVAVTQVPLYAKKFANAVECEISQVSAMRLWIVCGRQ
jgi:BTB/POZ domain